LAQSKTPWKHKNIRPVRKTMNEQLQKQKKLKEIKT